MRPFVARRLVPLAVAAFVASGCSASTESLEGAVQDRPGVLEVEARENDGDDHVPGTTIPKHVTVLMEGDASVAQVMAVFESYGEDIDDGEVDAVEVVLDGPKRATLVTGEGIRATEPLVRDLVGAQPDDAIATYRREAFPVLPSVRLTLDRAGFRDVVSVADRYRGVDGIDYVEVVSGDFVLMRDAVNGDPALSEARERFVRRADARWRLTGAVVGGRGPLELFVGPSEATALREHVATTAPGKGLGRVVVHADGS